MRILVLGGAGYLGDAITDALVADKHQITVYDNLLYQDYYLKDIPFICGDIRDREKLSQLLPQYDAIVLLAGIVGDMACDVFQDKTVEINTTAPKWVFDNFNGKIFFMSTCSVFGRAEGILDEASPTAPLSLYASTKLEAEQYLLNKKKNALCFRLGTVYGKSGNHSRPRLDLVGNIMSVRAAMGETINVYGESQFRPLINCLNVADAVAFGLRNDISGMYVLSESNYTLGDIARKIVEIIPGSRIEHNNLAVSDLRNYKVSPAKFYAHGWRPKYTFEDGVNSIKHLVQQNRIKDANAPIYHNGRYLKGLGTI